MRSSRSIKINWWCKLWRSRLVLWTREKIHKYSPLWQLILSIIELTKRVFFGRTAQVARVKQNSRGKWPHPPALSEEMWGIHLQCTSLNYRFLLTLVVAIGSNTSSQLIEEEKQTRATVLNSNCFCDMREFWLLIFRRRNLVDISNYVSSINVNKNTEWIKR